MAEAAARILRDGALEGEFAPALMIQHEIPSSSVPSSYAPHASSCILLHFLRTLCSHISAGKAQAKRLVFVVTDRSPESYLSLLESLGQQQVSWLHFVDCYSDPLGWRKFSSNRQTPDMLENGSPCQRCHNIDDLSNLLSVITSLGHATPGSTNDTHFSVVIDSVSSLLWHNSTAHVAQFLNKLRSYGGVSSIIWLLHSGLHDTRIVLSLEYIATIIASIEQHDSTVSWNGNQNMDNMHILRFRQKRRNGRIRELVEDFNVDKFKVIIHSRKPASESLTTSLPLQEQVQFKLQLSDKERNDRARVILPFEHQGNGRESFIYNGRISSTVDNITASKDFTKKVPSEMGEINYLRDSDDERPDSDEDPDDDLDI